jgi:putative oxidoreductase
MLGRILKAGFVPTCTDLGILLLRVGAGSTLFLRHGWEKVSTLTFVNDHFPDPLGIGHSTSWAITLLCDGVASLLIVLGIGTRWLAALAFVNITIAWAFVHHFSFWDLPGKKLSGDHGELIVLYLWAFAALMVTGSGKYSVEGMLKD